MHIDFMNSTGIWINNDQITAPAASARYREIAPQQALKAYGHESRILTVAGDISCEDFSNVITRRNPEIISIGKVMDSKFLQFAQISADSGALINVDICDIDINNAKLSECARWCLNIADTATCPTPALAAIIAGCFDGPISVIPDPTLAPGADPRSPAPRDGVLRAVWFGSVFHYQQMRLKFPSLAAWLQEQVSVRSLELSIITLQCHLNHLPEFTGAPWPWPKLRINRVDWSEQAVWSALAEADICFLPSIDTPFMRVKSANRLIEALAMGCLPIASPTPAYQPFADVALVSEDFPALLDQVLAQPEIMRDRIVAGQRRVAKEYSPLAIGAQWATHFAQHAASPTARARRAGRSYARVAQNAPLRLNLGCGDKVLDGYVNIDVVSMRGRKPVDVLHGVETLPFIPDDSVDEILSVHVIEHFDRWRVEEVLREWRRVLKPGGQIVLETPNLLFACAMVAKNHDKDLSAPELAPLTMWPLYGDPGWKDPLMMHRWLFSPQSLAQAMHAAGFIDISQQPAQFKRREPRDMRLVARKPVGGAAP